MGEDESSKILSNDWKELSNCCKQGIVYSNRLKKYARGIQRRIYADYSNSKIRQFSHHSYL